MSISVEDALTMKDLDGAPRRDMRPRNGQGQLIKASDAESTPAKPVAEIVFPFRVWTAGPGMPQETIYVTGNYAGLQPYRDGAYYLRNQAEYDAAKRALGARWWPDSLPESEPDAKCDVCHWHSRSFAALMTHVNQAHGRPQNNS